MNSNKYKPDSSIKDLTYTKYHRSYAFSAIRTRARNMVNKLVQNKKCQKCSFSYCFEVCHIKPIASFDEETSVFIVNHPSNLVILCPNCHWLFDNNVINIDFSVQDFITEQMYEEYMNNTYKLRKPIVKEQKLKRLHIKPLFCKICLNCGKCVFKTSSRCRRCAMIQQKRQKIQWPSIEEIIDRLKKESYRKIASDLGVSDNAVRKYIRRKEIAPIRKQKDRQSRLKTDDQK